MPAAWRDDLKACDDLKAGRALHLRLVPTRAGIAVAGRPDPNWTWLPLLGQAARFEFADRARIDPDMLDPERCQHVFQRLAVKADPLLRRP
jgi:hypothetical protein